MGTQIKLALGTVQLGMNYGVANTSGKPTLESTRQIIETALEGGITWLDTAAAYGNSEEVVGDCLAQLPADFSSDVKIVTKLPSIKNCTMEELDCLVAQSRSNLRRDVIDGLMLHDADDLQSAPKDVLKHFLSYAGSDHVRKVGVSVYSLQQAEQAIEQFGVQLIQVPSNLFDRTFVDVDFFERCASAGIQVFVRSLFLQGLFFLPHGHPKISTINGAKPALDMLHAFCKRVGCSVQELCFADALRFSNAYILIGAELPEQVLNSISHTRFSARTEILINLWDSERPKVTEEVIDPRMWI
ncbi:aldo/keto reductase [Akkermansiaceae bacterium]|nr:aldo/keto reductase [Akkermansiaceae bacterium]